MDEQMENDKKSFKEKCKRVAIYLIFSLLLMPGFYLIFYKIDWVDTIKKLKAGEIYFDDRDHEIKNLRKRILELEKALKSKRENPK